MSLTGETKNTIGLSNLSVEVWPSFEMSYVCPQSQYLQWLWSYEKISFRVEGGLHPLLPILHARRAKEALHSWKKDA